MKKRLLILTLALSLTMTGCGSGASGGTSGGSSSSSVSTEEPFELSGVLYKTNDDADATGSSGGAGTDSAPDDSDDTDRSSSSAASSGSLNDGRYRYYYQTLSADDKKVYEEIYACLLNHDSKATLSTTATDRISDLSNYVRYDNPEIICSESCTIYTSTIGLVTQSVSYAPDYTMSEAEVEAAWDMIDDFGEAFDACSSGCSTDYEKALAAYTYIVENTDYVLNAPNSQSMYSVVCGESVCMGYTMAYKYLCDRIGIPSVAVVGTSEGEAHAWNMICLDGNWCNVDVTWADPLGADTISYSWFGLSDTDLAHSHTADEPSLLPSADTLAEDYYYRNGWYFDSYSRDALKQLFVEGQPLSFKFSNKTAYDDAITDLVNGDGALQIKNQSYSISYDDYSYSITITYR